ncbi:uncharacterized protein LOC128767599 [Synchiropus splendidus]|uniref:uncharacterized protein LOC128767599 n=1 Tax=Synchiropus splendidus TaxID=270530 RepID=UPI00237D93ED|nr:uncharacterized protein LOC128767599 [Synchiropus splendidus]XP_053735707.1 uncharacterized protein LOC128767599 [Synchiropus splendidus]
MSDALTRRFRSQLTVAMDVVLRKAVMDIMSIFEASVCEYQKELLLKEDRLVRLTRKLARAELQLTRLECQKASVVKERTSTPQTQNGCEQASDAAVQTSTVAFVNSKQLLDSSNSEATQASLNSQDEMTPCVQVQRSSVQQSSTPKTEPEEVALDQQPSTSKPESSTGSSKEKKLEKKNVTQSPLGRSNLVIYLRDIKEGNSGHLEPETSKRKKTHNTPMETRAGSDVNAAHFVLKKQVTAEEESGRTPKKTCHKCKKVFPYPDAYEPHFKSCRKLKHPNSRKLEQTKSEERLLRSSRSLDLKILHYQVLENRFACCLCRQKFASHRSLAIHMRKHELKSCATPNWTEPIDDDVL